MNKYTVIYNKNSRGRNLNKTYLYDLFKYNNISFNLFEVTEKKETDEIIKNAIDNSVEHFTSVGGDGSLNYLVNSLLKNNHPNPVVSCLPAGSGSDFIRTFGISQKINEAITHLKTDTTYPIDVGNITFDDRKEYFINVANIGFLADTVKLSETIPNILSKYRYSIGFWSKIFTAKPEEMRLRIDGNLYDGVVFNTSICNAQYFGSGKNISPKSSLQDGKFNVQIFEVNKLTAMKLFFKANKGLHLREKGVINKLASEIEVLSKHSIENDGDFVTDTECIFSIENARIQFKI
tara:strand:- start:153 stop:1028 length:876 start_codon:yes stop_codon:yes gene_type:complete